MSYLKNGRDANEPELVKFWKQLGYKWIPMRAGQGFDGLLITPLNIYIVEIKNPAKKWKLEDNEKKLKEDVEYFGHEYHIIETMQDAEYLAGVI